MVIVDRNFANCSDNFDIWFLYLETSRYLDIIPLPGLRIERMKFASCLYNSNNRGVQNRHGTMKYTVML